MKIITALAFLLFSGAVLSAPNFTWDTVVGADGYIFYCAPAVVPSDPSLLPFSSGAYTPYPVAAPPIDMAGNMLTGTRYECAVTATSTDPSIAESQESNHIRYTPSPAPSVIEFLERPDSSTITVTW